MKHHGSHRKLLLELPGAPPSGQVDAIIVPTVRPAAYLRAAAGLARELDCRLVALCSGDWTSAERLRKDLREDGVRLRAFDLPAGYGHAFATSRLLRDDVLDRRADTAAKRNLGLALALREEWRNVVFLDDDIEVADPDDLRRATGLLDRFERVALDVGGFPDHSVVCHASLMTEGEQDRFVGAGALAVRVSENTPFFPSVYNEDWLFLLRDGELPELPVTGRAAQHEYDPYRSPVRAMTEEFGEVLGEGLYWLLDEERTVKGAGTRFWRAYLDLRKRFIDDVLARLGRATWEAAPRAKSSLEAARAQLSRVDADLCTAYLDAWAEDRDLWRDHLDAVLARKVEPLTPPRPRDQVPVSPRRPGQEARWAGSGDSSKEFVSEIRGPGETDSVKIKRAADEDLPALVKALGQPHYFAHALTRQREGHGFLLVAWQGLTAIGHIYVWLAEAEEEELRKELPGVPLLTHLELHPAHRRRGFGTALVHRAEQELIGRGHDHVVLGVGMDNHAAMALYTRHGFQKWKESPIETSDTVYEDDGTEVRNRDKCLILIKPISAHPSESGRVGYAAESGSPRVGGPDEGGCTAASWWNPSETPSGAQRDDPARR
ncbi:GNAT family N-acetyltransferase [Acrocarpospora catenulata]|uniref:GNAT family N-acetyltransferase n=1 Tax=Acrocarpospora catenulata TaxID=2836182 RepID=UPI002023AD88|nr:GNAT family N-acetyltransferase [Acrocarpospora catenulata]